MVTILFFRNHSYFQFYGPWYWRLHQKSHIMSSNFDTLENIHMPPILSFLYGRRRSIYSSLVGFFPPSYEVYSCNTTHSIQTSQLLSTCLLTISFWNCISHRLISHDELAPWYYVQRIPTLVASPAYLCLIDCTVTMSTYSWIKRGTHIGIFIGFQKQPHSITASGLPRLGTR